MGVAQERHGVASAEQSVGFALGGDQVVAGLWGRERLADQLRITERFTHRLHDATVELFALVRRECGLQRV